MRKRMCLLKKAGNSGFTLLELIAVIAILGILATIAIPRLGGFTSSSKNKADEASAQILTSAARMYKAEHGTEAFVDGFYDKQIPKMGSNLEGYIPNDIKVENSDNYFVFTGGVFVVSNTPGSVPGPGPGPGPGGSEPDPDDPGPGEPPGGPPGPTPEEVAIANAKTSLQGSIPSSGTSSNNTKVLPAAGPDDTAISWSVSGNAATINGNTLTIAWSGSSNTTITATLTGTISKSPAPPQTVTFTITAVRSGSDRTYTIQ